MSTHRIVGKWVRSAALVALIIPRAGHAADTDHKQFELVANPAFVRCLAAFPDDPTRPPAATVAVKRGKLNDQLTIKLRNVKAGLGFDLFTIEHTPLLANGTADPDFQANGGFGLAWYQSDLEVGKNHRGTTTIKTILIDQIFGFDSAVDLKPTNTFHVGFWFDSPAAVGDCGFAGPATPFNGEHNAGPLAMVSVPDATTDLGPLCLSPDDSTDPPHCNP